jgi:hypothetical protein
VAGVAIWRYRHGLRVHLPASKSKQIGIVASVGSTLWALGLFGVETVVVVVVVVEPPRGQRSRSVRRTARGRVGFRPLPTNSEG